MFPSILALDITGTPRRWLSAEDAIVYHAKDQVAWSLGEEVATLHGGIRRVDGIQSALSTQSIIAIRGHEFAPAKSNHNVTLSNGTLFKRDRHTCAYCGLYFRQADKLSRDHIIPTSKGGKNTWCNCVTACKSCNHMKADMTPEEAGMKLLYLPYVPNRNEHLILINRNIIADQFELLKAGIGKHSRIHQWYQ